jgi:hypothetical protein
MGDLRRSEQFGVGIGVGMNTYIGDLINETSANLYQRAELWGILTVGKP